MQQPRGQATPAVAWLPATNTSNIVHYISGTMKSLNESGRRAFSNSFLQGCGFAFSGESSRIEVWRES